MANMFSGFETVILSSLLGERVYSEVPAAAGNVIVGVAWDVVGAQDIEVQVRDSPPPSNLSGWEDTKVVWKTRERSGLIGGVRVAGTGPLAEFWYQGLNYYVCVWCPSKPDTFIAQVRVYYLQLGV